MASMHLFPEGVRELPNWVEDAYGWSDGVVSEHAGVLDAYGHLPPGQSLQQIAPPNVWKTLRAALPDLENLPRLKPWAASFAFVGRGLGRNEPGVEAQIIAREAERQRRVVMLETAEDVAALLDEAPADAWWQAMIGNPSQKEILRYFTTMYTAWSTCDRDRLAALRLPGGLVEPREQRRVMLEVRNQRWAERIARRDFPDRTLIIVGSLHFVGKQNLIAVLAASGIATDRLL